MKQRLLLCLIVLTLSQTTNVSAQTLVKNMSSTFGSVYATYKSGNSYYVGGNFSYVGLNTGYAALTKTNNDYPNMDFPQFNGAIYSLIPDGSGGWYAGGYFSQVAGVAKSNLAHIKSDNTVDGAFNANCGGGVKTIVKVGSRLYIGGDFTTVNGTPRNRAAAVSSSTGALVNGWNPNFNGSVNTIVPILSPDTTFWIGGSFTTVNATNLSRPNLVKVNGTNGNFIAGSLSANSTVNKLTTRGDSIFVGGNFSRFGLKTDYLSSITEGGTSSDQSMPNTNGQIRCIIPDGSGGWYMGGYFTQIGGISKNYVAHVKSDKTVDNGFTASCSYAVFAMVKDGTRLYLGGAFQTVNATPRNYLAAVSTSTGALVTGWDANASSYVYTLRLKDTVVLAGGLFTTIKGHAAYRFAALKKTDGSPVGGFPGYDNAVNKMAIGPSDSILIGGSYTHSAFYSPSSAKVTTSVVKPDPNFPSTNGKIYSVIKDASGNYYVGGAFTTIGGVSQAYVAKLNSSFQVTTGWAPQVNGTVRSMVLIGNTLYIGGQFSQTNTVARPYISALNTSNPGSNKTWNSALSNSVYSLVSDGTSMYAGGTFTTINGSTTRNLLAKFDLNGNLDATWNPNAAGGGGSVEQLAISGTNILAAGSFTTIGGVSRNYLAKLNNTNGNASNWATANSYVFALYVDGTTAYVGGYFTQLIATGGTSNTRNYLGSIVIGNGNIGTFNPNPNSYVYAINKSGTNLYYGGNFVNINGTARNYLAASALSNGALQSWNPAANSSVDALNVDGSNIIIGGNFSGFQETTRSYASIIRYTTQALSSWAPVIDYIVNDITVNATKIFIGGAFHTVNGASRNGFAALNLKGNLQATDLALTKNGTNAVNVYSLFATTNKIYVGGDFDKAGASLRNEFVEADISAGSGTVLATSPNPDLPVYAVDVQGTTIAYGGDFNYSNFSNRTALAIIKASTGKLLPFAPVFDYQVFDVAVNYNRIYAVGNFDNVGGAPHYGAVAFSKTNGAIASWNPNLTRQGQGYYADLYAVYADSNNVYLGGLFDQVAGTARVNAAIVAATNASLMSWNPGPNNPYLSGYVRTIALNGINLAIGGDFYFCKGAQRSYLAKIDSATGLVNSSWNPGCNGYVYALAGSGPNIYVGGSYSQLGGATRTSLGSVNASTGVVNSFDPVVQSNGGQGTVYALAFDTAGVLYAGGSFTHAKATARNNLAALGTSGSGSLKSWDPNAGAIVYAIAPSGNKIYVGGNFTTLNGATARKYLAAVNNTTGNVTSFDPNMGNAVYCLTIKGANLYAGGAFSTVAGGGTSRSYLAAYDAAAGSLKSWNPVAGSYVYGIAAVTDTVYVGGYLTTLNGNPRLYEGAVRGAAGTTTLAYNPTMNSYVRNHYTADHILLIGGDFGTVGGFGRQGFAVYDLPGSGPSPQPENAVAQKMSIINVLKNNFTVSPNPARGIVTVKLQQSVSGKLTVTLTDMAGNKVLQQIAEGSEINYIKLNVAALKSGTYVVNFTGKEISLSGFLIVAN